MARKSSLISLVVGYTANHCVEGGNALGWDKEEMDR